MTYKKRSEIGWLEFNVLIPIKWPGLFFIILIVSSGCQEQKIDFNTQVRPILNKNCISCHGGVKQSGGFGLVFRESALAETKNGNLGIVPGFPEKSEMISRITHKDPEMRMPFEREPLSNDEIEILRTWIKQGAEWKMHWAYIKPQYPKVPESTSDWIENEVDNFILKEIQQNNLSPSIQADPYDLVRRVYLDLTGLPPTPDQVEEFIRDDTETAYENLVDRLLLSPAYGEHMASMWLDLARYADSKGYEADRARQIWKYRDWVIRAFNDDMPFDQFTIEQLAGDLLTVPSKDQLIATAFHRNTLNNDEGGTDNEEYRIASVIDRVNTTWEVWQSTTMGCVQCHSHPYDPIRQKEYYSSFAFFNNTSDWDVPSEHPVLKQLKEEDERKLDKIKRWIEDQSTQTASNKWEKFILVAEPKLRAEDFDTVFNIVHFNRSNQDYIQAGNNSIIKIEKLRLENIDRIYLSYNQWVAGIGTLSVRTDSINGIEVGKVTLRKTEGFKNIPIRLSSNNIEADLYFVFESKSEDYKFLIDGFLPAAKLPGDQNSSYYKTYDQIDDLLNAPFEVSTPIMIEKPDDHSRQTNVFVRGNWLVKGDQVLPAIPNFLNEKGETFDNRLDFANWLVSKDNSLTGRVMVNRIWAKLFGRGIVITVEDFGTLGEAPTHPELLDWLAIKFSDDWNWSIKKLIKTIVMSATYKQSSKITDNHKKYDPDNKWLARSPRVRLSAEQIRDQSLLVSGLLSSKMYGPSVMPFQPEGIWTVVYNDDAWIKSDGEDAFRRGLYTYLRRSSPYPSFVTFDAAGREFCLSRRINTNTPLQAFVTLNDPVYFEAATYLANQLIQIEGDKKEKVERAYFSVMGKMPKGEKLDILINLLNETEVYYQEHEQERIELVKSDNSELAAMTVMVNALMNMDEFIVKN